MPEKTKPYIDLNRKHAVIALFSFVYTISSFFYENRVFFEGAAENRPLTRLAIKLLTFVTIYCLTLFFVNALKGYRERSASFQTLMFALPLFAVITGFWLVCHAYPFTEGDQFNILMAARSYSTMSGFFNYWTMYIPMVAMSIVPIEAFAIVFKIWLMSMAVGYCIYRLYRLSGSRLSLLLYLPFLLPPGLYQSYSIHRCPMYAVLYLLFACILICDHAEGVKLSRRKFLLLCFMSAVLTQWRSEGIYLLVLAPLIIYFTYRPALNGREKVLALALIFFMQLVVWLPSHFEKDKSEHRALPFFEYLITGMERKGLDREKNAADLEIVNRYISMDVLHEINEVWGDYSYNDNIAIFLGALVDGATDSDIENFQSAMIRLILRNPLVYIRNQLCAWDRISSAFDYDRAMDYPANIFKNLYVMTLWLLALWIYLLVKKKWCYWFITSGHLCHMAITTALLPAAYFKYYYSEYLFAALTMTLALIILVKKKKV